MERYNTYKDSGIEWIGEIPEHWVVEKLGWQGTFSASGIDKKTVEEEPLVKMINYTDVYGNENLSLKADSKYMIVSCPETKIKVHQVSIGDLIFTPSSETIDEIGISALVAEEMPNTVYSYHVIRLRFIKDFDINFRKYLCNNNFVLSQFSRKAKGTTRQIIGRNVFKSINVVIPPKQEQTKIANYLDQKTTEINQLITHKETLLKHYAEEKTAIINQAVTKGINPNVKLKDSGVNWLGDIPVHWEVKRLRYLGNCSNGISKSGDNFGFGFPFVSYGDVYKNLVLPNFVIGLVNSTESDKKNYSVIKGDVFFTRTSETIEEIGITSICLNTIKDAVFAGFLIRFRPFENKLFDGFSKYYFSAKLHRRFFVKEMNLVTRASLSQALLKKLPVLLPSIEEQKIIASFLDDNIIKINTKITNTKKLIALLKEYKTALISEVVTGKIKVS